MPDAKDKGAIGGIKVVPALGATIGALVGLQLDDGLWLAVALTIVGHAAGRRWVRR